MKLTITRSGSCTMNNKGENKCASIGHRIFRYKAQITIPQSDLDEQGFIVNHFDLDQLVNRVANTPESCENICIKVVDAIRQLMESRCQHCHRVHFLFWPEGGQSTMEAEWNENC